MADDLREAVWKAICIERDGRAACDAICYRCKHHTDAAISALGIPLGTLMGLRDGSLVAVPVEPTEAMERAAFERDDVSPAVHYGLESMYPGIYRAMLAARPNATEAGHE